MFFDPRLFLNLSTGPVPSPQIIAVNLDTYSVAGKCGAVAVWLKGSVEPCYFAHGTPDAGVIASWADTQYGEQFLRLSQICFAVGSIEAAMIDDHAGVSVRLIDEPLPFVFLGDRSAHAAMLLWAGEDLDTCLAAYNN